MQDIASIAWVITALICCAYWYSREGWTDSKRLLQSYRFDLLILVILGALISVSVSGVGSAQYQKYVGQVNGLQLILLCAAPVLLAFMLMFKAFILGRKHKASTPFFINDEAKKSKEDDLLNFKEQAENFAERVLNGGESDSLIFGIDAPWGIGKSSFVNFCCEYWQNKTSPKIIVHRFEPLRYDEHTDLTEKFVDDLVSTIQKHAFIPAIRPLFSQYSRLIKGKSEFSFLGMQFAFEPSQDTVEDTLQNLEVVLSELDRKIIVVVDDLDRISWSAIKNVLFAIKRSFRLPNISYVLCYDTENIVSLDAQIDDVEKVQEFLEKFVTVKISLFLDSAELKKYVTTNFELAIKNNLMIDPQIKLIMNQVVKIIESDDFFLYRDFLGDIRKLKRLINMLILFEIEKTDFENSDFNQQDLIHLLLVYMNYPHIFRKIYDTEANGKNAFFSLGQAYDGNQFKLEYRPQYSAYFEKCTPNQQFLLAKLFGDGKQEVSSDNSARLSHVRFNGAGSTARNLERYLNLIVNQAKPEKLGSHQFYVNKKNELLSGRTLTDIFSEADFSLSNGDVTRDKLLRVIVNSSSELSPKQGGEIVSYLMAELPNYSLLKGEKIGVDSRSSLIYYLVDILDVAAWGTDEANRPNNSPENIAEIADWVFGERSHDGAGVVSTLAQSERGVLGLHDLLFFRLYCSATEGGNFFNLQRALSLHGDLAAPTSGLTTNIAKEEMREISQAVFRVFKEQYITPQRNLFEAIDNLSLKDFSGECFQFVQMQVSSGKVSQAQIDQLVAIEKSKLKQFIVYQLGNSTILDGIGCGYYDEAGKDDQKGIATQINNYLFDLCFNPAVSPENHERYLDYLLGNLTRSYGRYGEARNKPSLVGFTSILDKERLSAYWEKHKTDISALNFNQKDKRIVTRNYTATYKDDLPDVYYVLDELIAVPK